MGMDQQLFAKFYVRDKASKNYIRDGSPVDIPLSADPACGIRHFDNVTFIMIEMLYWRRNEGVHDFLQNHSECCFPNDCASDIHVPTSTIMDLRDELIKLSKGEKSELNENFDCYMLDNGEIDKDGVMKEIKILDEYLHMCDNVRFVYSYSW